MNTIFDDLKSKVIVSCQAEGESPFNNPSDIAKFAITAKMGGASGLRSEGYEKTKTIKEAVDLPLIGLIKSEFEDGYVRITGSEEDVIRLIKTDCEIIAIDGTFRYREGHSGPEFIRHIKNNYNVTIMADISSFNDGVACWKAGADCLSTTLAGYTPETTKDKTDGPNFRLVELLSKTVDIPLFAEGRVNTPDDAVKMIKTGAWGVVVGSAITRPQVITSWYVNKLKKAGLIEK